MKLSLNKIETRNLGFGETQTKYPKYLIRGYAVAPNVPHIHTVMKDREGNIIKSFRSLFTENAIHKLNDQLKHKEIFVDALHEIAANLNSKNILDEIKRKAGDTVNEELALLDSNMKMKQLPLFKAKKFDVLDKGLFVEIESNPYFAEIDGEHEKYHNAIMGSLLNGYINGMSINFITKPDGIVIEEGLEKINDMDIYGISLVPNASLGPDSSITEVVMRSIREIIETREEKKMEQQEKVEKIDPKIIERMVQDKLDEEIKRREMESQKVQQEKDYKHLQEELELLKHQKEELEKTQRVDAKGLAPQPAQSGMSKEDFISKVRSLSPGEAIMLQADPKIGKMLPPLMKVQDYPDGKNKWYRTETRLEPVPEDMRMLHEQLSRKGEEDITFKK